MAKFGLGQKLSDLQTEMGQAPEASTLAATLVGVPERVVVRPIPIKQIGANPDQPRKTFTESELNELADSIREHGVLQPIIVRSVMGMPHLYEIVAGERRWRASQIAGKDTIPALVKPMTTENAMEIALIENVQRENLNAIEEGAAYKNIMDKCGYSMADVSRLIGKSESYIRNIMRLETLPDGVKSMVEDGKLSASHARTLAVAENADALAEKVVAEDLSVQETARLVQSAPRSKETKRAARKSEGWPLEEIQQTEKALSDALELRVKLSVKAKGKGSVTIHVENYTQLELLIALLKKSAGVGV